ncbi:siderophore-interacting protein [Allokutzneria albata]|uniref:NADPH-dependent ferric siderophore reductase, contains FAD-binding and SIP domains n=1 Tax=Allokutzneria albata TaxID=211114 RepID=A0A1H0DQN0_ALLAB|nr:siderophore-interacting protein [Allokutzneria albata]SDN72356.1 NADPH-dependent ferric siderophore reductase, contains FAD-binding and SIP domains [Allokutzneria albata]
MTATTDTRPAPSAEQVLSYVHFRAQVREVRRITPNMARVTFGGPDLAGLTSAGKDQRIKLFFPLPGQDRPVLTSGPSWYQDYLAQPEDVRPVMRTYTLRAHRPERNEVDVDFVLHGDTGPASTWAARAQRGDHIGLLAPNALHTPILGYEYHPASGTDWHLLAGDETALPAIGGIIESLPAGAVAKVFVEVPEEADRQEIRSAADVEITWLAHHHGPSRLVDTVRAAQLPSGQAYAWIAGECTVVKHLRRHLLRERGVAKDALYFSGYWRRGADHDNL